MKTKIQKIKFFGIMSNGSLYNYYKTTSNSKIYSFLEKDCVNFFFNLKIKNTNLNINKSSSKYKNKYVN
jgi:hypothetical protein